jgi:hypothetical protein
MSSDFANRFAPDYAIKLAVLAALFLGGGSGCGAKGAGSVPDLIPVKGKVSLLGQPLTTGTIRFEPDDFGRPASGKLQSDGTFVLTTTEEGDGVVAGHHRVSITNISPKSKEGALLKKYTTGKTAKPLEADVSAEQSEFTFDIR